VDKKVGLLIIYGPQTNARKRMLWDELGYLIRSETEVIWIVLGDFNVVRSKEERKGSHFDSNEASDYNDFISSSGLYDIQFAGRRFTRFSKDGLQMSKLDRILVTSSFFNFWKDPFVQVLHRSISDHCPILLKVDEINFGPSPFRVFDSGFKNADFHNLIVSSWNSFSFIGSADFKLKEKLKALKQAMKTWARQENEKNSRRSKEIDKALFEWDLKAEPGVMTEVDVAKREDLIFESLQLELLKKMDLK